MKHIGSDPLTVDRDGPHSLLVPIGRRVGERSELTNGLGLLVKRKKVGKAERPAAIGDPITLLKVERVERAAFPSPIVGGSTEMPGPSQVEREIWRSMYFAGVKRLGGRIWRQPAELEEGNAERPSLQRKSDGDAGRPGADDADIGLNNRPIRDGARVDKHFS